MTATAKDAGDICAVYVDMGTTNTRAWLMQGSHILASESESTGIRDAARDGPQAVRDCLRRLIAKVPNDPALDSAQLHPKYVVAAGMIGSNLGLAEIPYIHPPAAIDDLTASSQWHHFPDVSDLPVLLVPGIRSGPGDARIESINQVDVMRGEETLCAGLIATGAIAPPAIVLNLGSHWKAIQLDHKGRIQSSVTSLSGELLHAVQLHTVLAGSVPRERPQRLSSEWLEAGMSKQRQSGLARALFCIRLLDLENQGSPEDRFAFAVGAFIASDLDGLLARGVFAPNVRVALVGHLAISDAWKAALSQAQITATIIPQEQAESALLEALRRILVGAWPSLESSSPVWHAHE